MPVGLEHRHYAVMLICRMLLIKRSAHRILVQQARWNIWVELGGLAVNLDNGVSLVLHVAGSFHCTGVHTINSTEHCYE